MRLPISSLSKTKMKDKNEIFALKIVCVLGQLQIFGLYFSICSGGYRYLVFCSVYVAI